MPKGFHKSHELNKALILFSEKVLRQQNKEKNIHKIQFSGNSLLKKGTSIIRKFKNGCS